MPYSCSATHPASGDSRDNLRRCVPGLDVAAMTDAEVAAMCELIGRQLAHEWSQTETPEPCTTPDMSVASTRALKVNEDQGYAQTSEDESTLFLRDVVPSPSPRTTANKCNTEKADETQPSARANVGQKMKANDELFAGHAEGRYDPTPVRLPNIPAGATPAMRAIAEDFELLYGLRIATYERRPVPYGCRWVAERIGLGPNVVSRAIRELVACGALSDEGRTPGMGTRQLLPGAGAVLAVPPRTSRVEGVVRSADAGRSVAGAEPQPEAIDQGTVIEAVLGEHLVTVAT